MTDKQGAESSFTDDQKRELIEFAKALGENKYTMDDTFEFIFADLIKKYGDPNKVLENLSEI